MNTLRLVSAVALLTCLPTLAFAAPKAKAAPKKAAPTTSAPKTTSASLPAPAAAPAQPEQPADPATPAAEEAGRWSFAALGGFGANSTKLKDNGVETKDSFGVYGAGFGARAGYTLPMKVYVGATFVYHVGETVDKDGFKLEGSIFYIGPEGGYELALGPVIARPYLGVGYASVKATASAGNAEIKGGGGKVAVWPGASVLYPIDRYFVGVDARFVVVPGLEKEANANAFSAFATAGARF